MNECMNEQKRDIPTNYRKKEKRKHERIRKDGMKEGLGRKEKKGWKEGI